MFKKNVGLFCLFFALTLGVAGCAPKVIKTPPPNIVTYNIHKTVLANQTLTVAHSITLNPDCTVRGFGTFRIIQPPVHGTVKIVKREDFTSFPSKNPRFVCNKKKHPGNFVDYTPDSDFAGPDFMIIESITLSGEDTLIKVSLLVK